MAKYTKAIIALLGALATWGVTASEDGVYTQVEVWGALLALTTALGVWAAPNRDGELNESGLGEIALILLGAAAAVLVLLVLGWVNTSPK